MCHADELNLGAFNDGDAGSERIIAREAVGLKISLEKTARAPPFPGIIRGIDPEELPERTGERALRRETGLHRRVDHSKLPRREPFRRKREPAVADVFSDGDAEDVAENAIEMEFGESAAKTERKPFSGRLQARKNLLRFLKKVFLRVEFGMIEHNLEKLVEKSADDGSRLHLELIHDDIAVDIEILDRDCVLGLDYSLNA